MKYPAKIDLHMHTRVSDGTDTPEEILQRVREAGIRLFSVTDHDAIKACGIIRPMLKETDPVFINGIEFSCKDEEGKYHILGYGYDPDTQPIVEAVRTGHELRMKKVRYRLDFLKNEFGFRFTQEEVDELLALDNPGKPHIGNLMVRHGYAPDKDTAIEKYINQAHYPDEYLRPEQAIEGILESGGIPVLAHPTFGSGNEIIEGDEMERRLRKLTDLGLQGVEVFYSGFSPERRRENLAFAEKFGLFVTAGSDYHGTNKQIPLGHNHLDLDPEDYPAGLKRFLDTLRNGNLV